MLNDIFSTTKKFSSKNRTRFVSIICTLALLLTLFTYVHYYGDYSNTYVYFVLPPTVQNDLQQQQQQQQQRGIFDKSRVDHETTVVIASAAALSSATDEQSIRKCFIPKLLVDDPSLQHLMKHYGPLKCSSQKNWVYTSGGKFYIDPEAVLKYGSITCNYYDIRRGNEYNYTEIKYSDYKNGSDLLNDSFRVQCEQKDSAPKVKTRVTYTNFHAGVPKLTKYEQPLPLDDQRSTAFRPHVLIYLMDSMSRINFLRKLPKFYKVLTEQLDAQIMEGFNVVGDGTPWAVIPMTTGHFQTELPEARKRFHNSSYIDDWPFIFKDYQRAGYATSYVEEQPLFSAFTYKLKGFKNPPVDHYLRTMLIAAEKRRREHKPYCFGDTPKSLIWLKYWRELLDFYDQKNRPTFSFLFSSETSHDDYNLVQVMDDHLSGEFETLLARNYTKNSFVIVMGDHGRRFGPVRQTQSGKLEEKLPFLALSVPQWFKTRYPESYANLKFNTDKLVTVFDLHATLKHILNFTSDSGGGDGGEGRINSREISLFNKIPESRSCENAQIKTHFCSCLNWNDINRPELDPVVQNATHLVIEKFNEMVAEANGMCTPLTLGHIISARTLEPREELMAFKESQDYDNYVPDLTGNRNLSSLIYQIRFTTKPADADFEVSVTHFVHLDKFVFSENDISRLNMYSDQPNCIINSHHHLRQYCYCVNYNDTQSALGNEVNSL